MMFDNQQAFDAWTSRSRAGRRHVKAADRASEAERKWFEQHPDATEYTREAFPHEFPPVLGSKIDELLVTQLKSDVRSRLPVTIFFTAGAWK